MTLEKHKYKILILILFIAFLVRILDLPYVFSGGNISFFGVDTYYHVRRIEYSVLHFPNILLFDSYIDFPYGAKISWAPLYDQFIALASLITGFGHPSLFTIEIITAIIPVLFGLLAVLFVFLIAEKIFDWRIGIISAAIFAIIPSQVYSSFLGNTNHHVAETLISTADFLLFVIGINYYKNNFKNIKFPLLTGIAFSISLFIWEGGSIYIGLIGIYILVQFIIDRKYGRDSDYLLTTGSKTFLIALLIVAPFAILRGGFDIYLPSLFHVIFLSSFLFLCMFLKYVQRLQFKKWWYYPLSLISIFVFSFFVLKTIFPQFITTADYWIRYLFGGGILSTIQEAIPLFMEPGVGFTLDNAWNDFTFAFFISILAFLFYFNRTVKQKFPPIPVFMIVWTVIVFILAILQRRFVNLLSVNISIFTAYFIFEVSKLLSPTTSPTTKSGKKKGKKKKSIKPIEEASKWPIIALIFLFVFAIPNILILKAVAGNPAPDPEIQESYRWLKDNSPNTSYYENPVKPAEYGVMSWWDYGNWILYFSERPVVANNFQTGVEDAAHFFTETNEKIANEILDKRKVRFIVTDAQMVKLKFGYIASLAGKDPGYYYGVNSENSSSSFSDLQIKSVNYENEHFFATMLSRLHVFDANGLYHYRLIYESRTSKIRSPDIKYIKIFEYVPGAVISGKGYGNIKVTLDMISNQGRNFSYTQNSTANGTYEIIVPYSTTGNKYETKSVGNYKIEYANVTKDVSISEDDVLEGKKIQVI